MAVCDRFEAAKVGEVEMPIITTSQTNNDGYPVIEYVDPEQEYIVSTGVTLLVTTESVEYGEGIAVIADQGQDEDAWGAMLINQGSVIATENYAVLFNSYQSTIINAEHALIQGVGGIAVGQETWVENRGSIVATSPSISVLDFDGLYEGIGINVTGEYANATISNSGSISGSFASIASYDGGTVTLMNSGVIFNDINFWEYAEVPYEEWSGRDTILNGGTIFGDVWMGYGADLYDGRQGMVYGWVDGGSGDDKLLGSAQDDFLAGGEDNDVIRAGYGNDDINGGEGRDKLTGGGGRDTFIIDIDPFAETQSPRDRIHDFLSYDDTILIRLINAPEGYNPGLDENGELVKSALRFGLQALDNNDFFIYNEDSGVLKFDWDAKGGDAAIAIAKLDPDIKFTFLDIDVEFMLIG
jgi:Ca2+-binding RTX toxin-like protein